MKRLAATFLDLHDNTEIRERSIKGVNGHMEFDSKRVHTFDFEVIDLVVGSDSYSSDVTDSDAA